MGERFEPTEAMMNEGKTTAPGYLTEPDLIALMDANGIGTDATMAEHIAKVQNRDYCITRPKVGGAVNNDDEPASRGARGGRGGRGRGRGGRGGGAEPASGGNNGILEFIPTTLGVALIQGFENMDLETSLGKPFLRKEMESRMKDICEGRITKNEMIRQSISQYRQVFEDSTERLPVLQAACRRYVLNAGQ
ncbi:putative DNA topoisomerase 3 [Glarea lozoyensis 74030]|nr:putative DNA topoisomerase 3 [Glarea lozoyensis 74030]